MNRRTMIEQSGLFSLWHDPQSGVCSYILDCADLPLMQSFYFTNPSFTTDGRYWWFYVAHPPSGNADAGRCLGVVDFRQSALHWFPDTQFRDASPFIDLETGEAYWCAGYAVYKRSPDPSASVQMVNQVPEDIHRNRAGKRLATHLTRSADGRELFIDAQFGDEWVVGSLPIDGGDFEIWRRFDRCYNHAQFCPTRSGRALIAQDWWLDVATGEHHGYDQRIWCIDRCQEPRPMTPPAASIAHEWWDADGEHIWYVDYEEGTKRVVVESGQVSTVWSNGTCHSHCNADASLLVGDIGTYTWGESGCRVACYQPSSGREVNIVSSLPEPCLPRGRYHIDPHPQFCCDDQLVAYTTTVRGRIECALVLVEDVQSAL